MFFLVDAFTDVPFRGNPAGIYFLDEFPSNEKMLEFSYYHNWSEIAYLKRLNENTFYIKWFAPKKEAPLCGHATLASSHVIFSNNLVPQKTINFEYGEGKLRSELNEDGSITMTFPAKPVRECTDFPFSVKEIFGTDDYVKVLKDDLIYIVIFDNANIVKNLKPKFEEIKKINARAVAVSAPGNSPFDFTSRYFPPSVGVNEDPVCGSMHCRLTYFWAHELGKRDLYAFQASSRSGILNVSLVDEKTVTLTSRATTICRLESYINL